MPVGPLPGRGVDPTPGPHSTNTVPAENIVNDKYQRRKGPPAEYHGGPYRSLLGSDKKVIKGTQINHIPPVDVMKGRPGWTTGSGPAIQMDYIDHREVRSTGRTPDTKKHRDHQKRLVDAGQIDDAVALDIQDIRRRFGSRYDQAIHEMVDNCFPQSQHLKHVYPDPPGKYANADKYRKW